MVNVGNSSNMIKWERDFESKRQKCGQSGKNGQMCKMIRISRNILWSMWETKSTWSNGKVDQKAKIELWSIWEI